jgi:predicted O-methyltransferase YrrM
MSTPWSAVDDYLCELFAPDDPALAGALAKSEAAGLPAIHVAPNQGKLLQILARAIGARRILEIGTLGGYSTIWLARALPPEGRLVTIEADARHAEVARENITAAGLLDRVELHLGQALDVLAELIAAGAAPFDLVFIDADKPNNPEYFLRALQLSHPGTLIVIDNVVRKGAVIDADSEDANVQGVRQMNAAIAACPNVTGTALQTVGSKGYDGLAVVLVVGR